ncbi:DUF4391 domain-containing protein [Bifidobacterium biavatii]|uniref:Tmp1 n=1 Tax=Bifidobacterium biavatii DSM 23969 TaxID=1437608 RepID=A0A087A152_9BIFI|nr:DUF4391 domain-containing protein [Bifidobacterium biavatii]KFI52502.1 hypothetical protein BBIA_0926 [Bifidobacterium biavatii DSM 23969]
MTVAHCGSVSALTLGLPAATAIPEAKGSLPKAMFVGHATISAKLSKQLKNDIAGISLLAIARPANTQLTAGAKIPEILVIGLKLAAKVTTVPTETIELIAAQRKSGIVFAVVRGMPFEGTTREECTLAVRRALPGRAGHTPVHQVFAGEWKPAGEVTLETDGVPEGASTDDLWESICAQIILGTPDGADLDARITRRAQIRQLEATVDKLVRDHQRAKDADQRNEIYAQLHKAKQQLDALVAQATA